MQHADGSLLLPRPVAGEGMALSSLVGQAMAAHSSAWSVRSFSPLLIGTDRRLVKDPVGNSYLTYTLHRSPGGSRLWVAEDISTSVASLRSRLLGLAGVWILCLVLTLVAISILTRRIVQPLKDLHRLAASVTSASLASSHLKLDRPPWRWRSWRGPSMGSWIDWPWLGASSAISWGWFPTSCATR